MHEKGDLDIVYVGIRERGFPHFLFVTVIGRAQLDGETLTGKRFRISFMANDKCEMFLKKKKERKRN